MEINQVKTIFPQAVLRADPVENDQYLNFPVGNEWLILPANGVSGREIALLKLLLNDQSTSQTLLANGHRWFRRLFLGEKGPATSQQMVRVIQIQIINQDPAITPTKWLTAFQSMFEHPLLDAFLISTDTAIAVEKLNGKVFASDDFLGISQTLDDDFYCTSKLYVGQYWPADNNLGAVFARERELFQFQVQQNTSRRVFTIANSILKYCFEKQLSQNELIVRSKHELLSLPDARETITSLYQNGGNVSNTAKQLYVHRNTLQYRIRKFQQATGFDLKDMNDLLFCYLLTFE
ncbi:hypothetical protein D1831_08810 [Lactiplantibacillus garii]|uniref:PucR C-terminal helix-turn-helix domain-containing protein n=1 Tax=Lactiplantibacillus garii TaxID=2306423 RepID=A0A426D6C9_9LACO|nr:helix-turn-helix domain-containing protein [Lactiplantibacillus garii]RRK10183.1 hypothetical protein D1831_08810 [Lactiplantibacillus garii]